MSDFSCSQENTPSDSLGVGIESQLGEPYSKRTGFVRGWTVFQAIASVTLVALALGLIDGNFWNFVAYSAIASIIICSFGSTRSPIKCGVKGALLGLGFAILVGWGKFGLRYFAHTSSRAYFMDGVLVEMLVAPVLVFVIAGIPVAGLGALIGLATTWVRLRWGEQFLAKSSFVLCLIAGLLLVPLNESFRSERTRVERLLAKIDGVCDIELSARPGITERIRSVKFSVENDPNNVIGTYGLSRYDETGRFFIYRIGKWKFIAKGVRHSGVYNARTGKYVESQYLRGSLEFGMHSPYAGLLPFSIETVEDIVEHYPRLVEELEKWPRESEPGEVVLADGTTQYFYVVEDPIVSNEE